MRLQVQIGSIVALALAVGASGAATKLQGHVAFSAGPLEPGRSIVFVYDLRTSEVTRVTRGRGVEFDPTLSPDGKRVAWRSTRNGNEEIRVANVDGSGVRNLTRHPAGDYAPAWSPDGRKIAFASTRDNLGSHVWVMNADGTNAHLLTRVSAASIRPGLPTESGSRLLPTSRPGRTGSTLSSSAPTVRTLTGTPGTTSTRWGLPGRRMEGGSRSTRGTTAAIIST